MLRLHKVLCVVRYYYRGRNSTRTVNDVIGVEVIKPVDFIVENIFERRMSEMIRKWSDEFLQKKPDAYCLLGFHVQGRRGFVRVQTNRTRTGFENEHAHVGYW